MGSVVARLLVVLARRFETRRTVTFNVRHFRVLRPLDGEAFTLLPSEGEAAGD
ncbi:MAG: hypothetical protein M3292_00480 [Actinomycetota bacterium]|nr:hypothetical protein [Actinomycetota bacterium]